MTCRRWLGHVRRVLVRCVLVRRVLVRRVLVSGVLILAQLLEYLTLNLISHLTMQHALAKQPLFLLQHHDG